MRTTAVIVDSTQGPDRSPCDKQGRGIDDALLRYWPSFYRSAFRYLGNAADAEDAVQDALLSAHKHLGQFRGQARISTWLTAIVINSARMQLRKPRQPHFPWSTIQTRRVWRSRNCYQTVVLAQRSCVAGVNLQGTFCSWRDGSHPRCVEHFNCGTWMASASAKRRTFSEWPKVL